MMRVKLGDGEAVETHCLTVEIDGAVFEILEGAVMERSLAVRTIRRPMVIRLTGGANHIELEEER